MAFRRKKVVAPVETVDAPVALDVHNPEHANLTYEELQALGK